jgi:hypothetical protein
VTRRGDLPFLKETADGSACPKVFPAVIDRRCSLLYRRFNDSTL